MNILRFSVLVVQIFVSVCEYSSEHFTQENVASLNYAVEIVETLFVSRFLKCAALCGARGWCVALVVCQEKGLSLKSCNLASVNVTQDYMKGDDISQCKLLYSVTRLQNLISCGGTPGPQEALVPCKTVGTSSGPTTPSSGCVNQHGGGCHCSKGATNENCTTFIQDCSSVDRDKDVYTIQPDSYPTPFSVYCDSERLVIQKRKQCDDDFFYRDWDDYKSGFGDVSSSCFWLGNEKIRAISLQGSYRLLVKGTSSSMLSPTSKYSEFHLGSESQGYALNYDSFVKSWFDFSKDGFGACPADQQLKGMKFHTHDNDNQAGCASQRKSGWWYNSACAFGDLNMYGSSEWPRSYDSKLIQASDVSMAIEATD